ncbi:MAG: endonuclease V [TACK group archaeon]|nr:endonuclease V [TACK group archaeon]
MVSMIPKGRVTTYGRIARALGDQAAARAVGKALSRNPRAPDIPCHRVVMADGGLGGYAFGAENKSLRLKSEGVDVGESGVDLGVYGWDYAHPPAPLKKVAEEQRKLGEEERTLVHEWSFSSQVAVDVFYGGEEVGYERACASAVFLRGNDLKVATSVCEVTSPYVPAYLHLREAGPVTSALDSLASSFGEDVQTFFTSNDAVLLVDGDGFMHPRRFGFASSLGYALGIPTIGVAKSLLLGQVVGQDVIDGGEVVGRLVKGRTPSGNRFFVSAGHAVSLNSAIKLVGDSYPRSLFLAHEKARCSFQ